MDCDFCYKCGGGNLNYKLRTKTDLTMLFCFPLFAAVSLSQCDGMKKWKLVFNFCVGGFAGE
jgi:hypothetical protein